jgi:MoxR-like ATPase
MELSMVADFVDRVKEQTHRIVMGHDGAIELMLVALLCRGHVLLEGVPGTAKTLLARTFAASLALQFKRIQFTPDLMPGDVVGINLFNFQTNLFTLTKGPVFTDVLLADEINRTPPKTQAALLEAMQERAVTIDGVSYPLNPDFLVIATQNPIEQQGTYPLPEAQLDRFMFKIMIGYPSLEEEHRMIAIHGNRNAMPSMTDFQIQPLIEARFLEEVRGLVAGIRLSEEIIDYIVKIVRATRESSGLLCGASPRSANMLAVASRACAAIEGRDFVIPDDVKHLVRPTLRHRLPLAPGAEIEGIDVEAIVESVLEKVPAPR